MRLKITLILCGVLACYILALTLAIWEVVYPRFAQIERERSLESVGRCIGALEREAFRLDRLCASWAVREDVRGLANAPDPILARALFGKTGQPTGDLDLILLLDDRGRPLWSRLSSGVAELPLEQAFPTDLPPSGLAALSNSGPGLARTALGPLIAASHPVPLGEDRAGSLVLGRLLDAELLQNLREQAQTVFTMLPPKGEGLDPEDRRAMEALGPNRTRLVHARDGMIHAYALLPAMDGSNGFLVRAAFPETITERGREAARLGIASGVLAGSILLIVLLAVLELSLVRPLTRLTRHIRRIRDNSDLRARIRSGRTDEIGRLAGEFDAMMEQVERLHRELGQQSYRLGMAEAASGVLHNLRNAMSPLPVNVERIGRGLRELSLDRLECAVGELSREGPGQRRQDLAEYVETSLVRLRQVLADCQDRLNRLGEVSAKTEAILLAYDELGSWRRKPEPMSLPQTLAEAAKLAPEHLMARIEFSLDPSLERVGSWLADPIQTQQILANLLANAAEAARPEAGRVRVAIRAEAALFRGKPAVRLVLVDDGRGIAPADLSRVFDRDFSTKGIRRPGLGLHWCANTANAMNGSLMAQSRGPGQGATFTLTLPQGDDHGPRRDA